jgi:hypothetical protein
MISSEIQNAGSPDDMEIRNAVVGKLGQESQLPINIGLHGFARVVGAFIGAFVDIV